ncbi:MAG: hypothetical protein D6761_10340 [Candidatus Dadabacteria bacterium]|nr:MAG: hypothetical protein D6761_10340 [Candidatus Dadabacteria bacterium]
MPKAYCVTADAIERERERTKDNPSDYRISNILQLDELELRPVGPTDVRFRVLAVSAEHNINHAALADTVNIAALRGGKIYPGNSALGEVVETGELVTRFKPGDIVITHCNGEPDQYGYPTRIWAYDMPDSIGWYGEEAVVGDWQLIPAPLDCGLNLWEIAALPLRAPTANHLWRRAIGMWRVKVRLEQKNLANVLGFGGGVSELFLMQAAAAGHNAWFCSGNAARRAHMEKLGIRTIDQKQFNRFASKDDVKAFGKEVARLTDGTKMDIVCDMLRGPVFDAGLAAMGREAVNVSAGWQLSKVLTYDSAGASVKQITLDHTHYDTVTGANACVQLYGRVYKPTIHDEIYAFEDLPRAFDELEENTQTGIPIIRVAKEMPDSVKKLIP